MSRTFIEKRVIQAGKELRERRIGQKGTLITADDIRSLKVKTFSPTLQAVYCVLGTVIFVLGLWVQFKSGNMAISVGLVLVGFLNVAYGFNGNPRAVSSIERLDLGALAEEIASSFVDEQDKGSSGRD